MHTALLRTLRLRRHFVVHSICRIWSIHVHSWFVVLLVLLVLLVFLALLELLSVSSVLKVLLPIGKGWDVLHMGKCQTGGP